MSLFVAIPLGAPVRAELESLAARLHPRAPALRWTSPESWQITLQFLGSAGAEQYPCLHERLAEVQ